MSNPCSRSRVKGFVRTEGRWMVNGEGERIVLRGYGVGNWTNPEGFMVGGTRGFSGEYTRPQLMDRARSMDWLIRELCGTEYARQFWPKWYRKHLGKRDIEAMAELGYNSVRLVLNAASLLDEEPGIHFNEDTFSVLDQVLDWCEQYRIYAILDLHTTPGGQSCGGCDDGVDNVPHLFLDEENWERTILLWEELARRYTDRWIVAGYDLLNEPLNNEAWFSLKDKLIAFYDDCIAHIRKIDSTHMLTIEGPMWSTMMEIFDHDYDPDFHNWCIHIHNYGFQPQLNEIMAVLDRAEELNVPIWMGEGGSGDVNHAVFLEMLAQEGIGYALWCWKTASSPSSQGDGPAVCRLPDGWQQIFDYADHGGPKPGYAKAQAIFDAYLDNLDYDRCFHSKNIHRYNLRQPGIVIPGAGYDHGEPDIAFAGNWTRGNVFEFRLTDRTKLVRKPGAPIINPQIMSRFLKKGDNVFQRGVTAIETLWLEMSAGEFAHYCIRDVLEPCPVSISLRILADAVLTVSAGDISQTLVLSAGETRTVPALILPIGDYWAVRIEVQSGTVQIADVRFDA